ncbi:hypothetical protein [Paenibacillus hexagrammi]|uniref:Uncharacterized protein n=1 Tax=Paenibacillus hexagrammi TaxID=2908839 RepID=A0ABY3SKK1_9BACL|nr:hypothetical protein [Paenibacillus sp. YPD9-1]UJF34397.1 hypothetical protein L0M14_04105 [Paenibacillus sp. YPD9-1]
MTRWILVLLSFVQYIPIILLTLVLFRQRIQPYVREIVLVSWLGAFAAWYIGPFACVIGMFALYYFKLKFRPVAAMLAVLSGYTLSGIISTLVLLLNDTLGILSTKSMADAVHENLLDVLLLVILFIIAKGVVISAMIRFRLGFTFLVHYTKIPFTRKNLGFYGFILIVLTVLLKDRFHFSILETGMSIQMITMTAVMFVYMVLREELGYE